MNLLPKSEKWLPVVVIVWTVTMISMAFYAAWIDAERYISMIGAVGESIKTIIGVFIIAVGYWSKIRMDYKEELAKLNPYFNDRYGKEIGIKGGDN